MHRSLCQPCKPFARGLDEKAGPKVGSNALHFLPPGWQSRFWRRMCGQNLYCEKPEWQACYLEYWWRAVCVRQTLPKDFPLPLMTIFAISASSACYPGSQTSLGRPAQFPC